MIDKEIVHSNTLIDNARYSANFDLIMHDFCLEKFANLVHGKNCLEMGCYHGSMTVKLAAAAKSLTALDNDITSIEMTKIACEMRANVSYACSSFENYSQYGDFDTIYFSHALEHVENDRSLLDTIFKQIKVGALLITVVPNALSLSRQIAMKMGILENVYGVTKFEKEIGHFRTYDQRMLQNLFIDAGFKIVEAGGIMPKIFSNKQFDDSLDQGVINHSFLAALNSLSEKYQDICSSIYIIATKDV